MAKQSINIGATANDRTGDSLRAAFVKVNENFTELYTALGLNADTTLNLGAFEFTGSVMTTTDSSAITIDQTVTVTSDLTVGGDVVPQAALGGNLGSAVKPWKSLYVSNNTIYIGGTALGVNNDGQLTINSQGVSKLISGSAEFALITDGPEPYTLFPAISTDDQLQIVGSEVSAVSGNLALTSPTDTFIISNGAGIGGGSKLWAFGADGSITFPDNTIQTTAFTGATGITASSSDVFTNKTINIQTGQNNTFQIQGNSISSYSGSGSVVLLQSGPTLNAFNIGNGSNLTVDGGTGSYWSGPTGVAQAGIDKAGVYRSSSSATNSLFTFAANGSGTMSAAVEGSLFIGTALPSNNGGLNSNYSGWLVVQSGGKFGGDLNTRGALIFDDAATGAVVFADGSRQSTAWDTGYLSFDDAALRGTSGYQYTFNTDGYFTSSTSSESTNYFFVTYNSTNLNIAAGWTVVGANCNTTVSSTVYPVAGYPGVIKINLTAAASSTSGFYPVVVTSPDRLKVQIQPNPGNASKYTFATTGITFPDTTVQTTAWTGIPGPYADDAAAATAGVAVGYPYHKTGTSGQVFVRLA